MTSPITAPGISWKQDYAERVNPRLMTRLLRTAIPALEHSHWYVESGSVSDAASGQHTLDGYRGTRGCNPAYESPIDRRVS